MMIYRGCRAYLVPGPAEFARFAAGVRAERDALQRDLAETQRELAESQIQRERLQAMLREAQAALRRRQGQDMARDIERDKRQAAERARERAIWQAEQATRDPSLPLQ